MEQHAYEAVRKGVGAMILPFERCLKMTGADRVEFLHGLVTNDVKALKEGEGCYAACLIPEGRMVSDLRIYALSEALLLLFKESARERLLAHLDHYLFAEEVQFNLLVDPILSLQGPLSSPFLSELSGETLSNRPESHQEIRLAGVMVRAFCHSHTGEEDYDLLIPQKELESVQEFLSAKGKKIGFRWIDEETFHRLRIEAGIPFFGLDMTEATIPVEAGLEQGAISYTKGCYTGQEVIAKVKYIGHVNRYLVGFRGSNKPFASGCQVLYDGKEAGTLTSATFSFHLGCQVALGYIKREFRNPGAEVEIVVGTDRLAAQIQTLPFYSSPSR